MNTKNSISLSSASAQSFPEAFIELGDILGLNKPAKKALTKNDRLRILAFMCDKKLVNDFDFYGYNLLEEKQKEKILFSLRRLCTYNKINFISAKVSDYWKELVNYDYMIPTKQ
jgi:hypothetical protein